MTTAVRQTSEEFEFHFRYFMTLLSFGIEMAPGHEPAAQRADDAPRDRGDEGHAHAVKRLGLHNPDVFFEQLYIPFDRLEHQLSAAIRAADRPVYLTGKPGCGKSSSVRKVLRDLKTNGHVRNVISIDPLQDAKDRDDLADGDPAGFLQGLERQIVAQGWEIYHQLRGSYTQLVRDLLSATTDQSYPLRPSSKVAEKLVHLRMELELTKQEGESDWECIKRERSRGEGATMYHIFKEILHNLKPADILHCIAALHDWNAKTVLLVDNLDAIVRHKTAEAVRDWLREITTPLLGSTVIVAVMRSENFCFFKPAGGDPGSVRIVYADFEDELRREVPRAEDHDKDQTVGVSARRHHEHRIVQARMQYLVKWYNRERGDLPEDVQSLFGALWACRSVRRLREDADALSNWNYRTLAASQGNFARELYLHLRADWDRIDTPDVRLNDALGIHIESLYYSWLSGALPIRGTPSYAIREYNPAIWHIASTAGSSEERSGTGRLLRKSGHLALAAIYNAALMSPGGPIRPADTSTVLKWMSELGFGTDQITKTLSDLCRAHSAFGPQKEAKPREEVAIMSVFKPEWGNERRFLAQALMDENYLRVDGHALPNHMVLTDRGRQLLEYIGIKTHFVIGLLDHQFAIRGDDDRSWRDLATAPVSDATFQRVYERLRRMAGYHLHCINEAACALRPIHEDWFGTLRRRYCVMNVDRARYTSGGGNPFMERLLLSVIKYLERINGMGLANDPSPPFLTKVRELRIQFNDFVENVLVPGASEYNTSDYSKIVNPPTKEDLQLALDQ